MSGKSDFSVAKLKGSENYHNWVFAMENYIEMKKLSDCLKPKDDAHPNEPSEENADKLSTAKSIIALSVEPDLYVHIRGCKSALAIWKTFQNMFEDRGLLRKIGLLRSLISVRLENCDDMQKYITEITTTASKLSSVEFEIQDDWLSAILLAGLTDEYKPLIMSFEAAKTINSDEIKMKLLDTEISSNSPNNAFYGKKNFKKNAYKKDDKKKKKCKVCTKWHAGKCNKISIETDEANTSKTKNAAFGAFALKAECMNSKDWYIDSGASNHMTPNDNILSSKKTAAITEITAANNASMAVVSAGQAELNFQGNQINVFDVMHVPNLTVNLLSVCKMVGKGNTIIFDRSGCSIYNRDDEKIAFVKPENGVYKIRADMGKCMITRKKTNESAVIWHRRMGHLNYRALQKLRDGAVDGMNFDDDAGLFKNCETCAMGKQSRQPFGESKFKTTQLLELIHSDLCGPMETISIGGAKYFVTFIDDFSKKVFCYFIKQKSDAFDKFVEFKAMAENQTGYKIKTFRTDNGKELLSERFVKFLKINGIQHDLTCPYTPQQNGVAERYNRTIIEKAKCLLHDSDLTKSYWGEAVNMSTYLINRSICSNWRDKTPEEVWTGRKVNLAHLKIFGSTVMVHVPKQKRQKLDYKSQKMIFVGYENNTKGYRCIDKATRKITITRDVIFHEQVKSKMCELEDVNNQQSTINDNFENSEPVRENNDEQQIEPENPIANEPVADTTPIANNQHHDSSSEYESPDDNNTDPNYVPDETVQNIPETPRITRARSGIRPLNLLNFAFIAGAITLNEAMSSPESAEWKNAMSDEMNSLMENQTWTLVDLPNGKKPLKTKWVFTVKRDTSGKLVRYKARLVAKGCSQQYGIDYEETFSPVVRYSTIRILIALAIKKGLKIDQMDAITAFLQGDLSDEIYIEQPEGFKDGSKQVCKLKKAMYGLKQAGRAWNLKLEAALKSFGLIKSKLDPCVYYNTDTTLILAIYVDDILIFWKNESVLNEIKNSLSNSFKMKDMGKAQGCIGIRIAQTNDGIELDQSKYINDILARFNMSEAKPISTPSDPAQKLSIQMLTEDDSNNHNIPYQEGVGSLLYVAQCTRPDIAFSVNDVSRFNSNFGNAHWNAVKRIMRYLKGTIDLKLKFTYGISNDICGYSDADWASDIDKRRSCTGFLFTLSGGAITWMSKRQATIALSTTEAEYMALSAATQEALWLRQLYTELDNGNVKPILIHCDNQGAIKLAEMDCYKARSKHIDIRHHFVREKIENSIIELEYIPTNEMAADSLTKAVSKEKVQFCAAKMGLHK